MIEEPILVKKKKKNYKSLILILGILLISVIGGSYAFFTYEKESETNTSVIAGSIYLESKDNGDVSVSGMYPMTDEEGKKDGVKYNFNIKGHNESKKGRTCRILNLEGKLEKTNGRFCVEMLEKDAETRNFAQQSRSVILGKDDGRLHDIVTALLEELRSDSGLKANKRGTMQELLLGQFYITIARQNGREGSAGRVEYIRKAQRFIENHYDQEIGITDVAEETGLSEGYLQRLYKAEKGISIMEEVIRLRIENAKLLLEISTLPVVDVAVQTGFNSIQHFSATFKKTVGCSPAEWRKMRGAVLTTGWEEIT